VSPQSRGRKKKPQGRRSTRRAQFDPLALMLRDFAPVAAAGDPLEAVAFASTMLGGLRDPLARDATARARELVDALSRRSGREALALLRAFAVVAETDELRDAARDGATSMRDRGASDYPWTARLDLEAVEAWQMRDVYGDQAMVVCVFRAGAAKHGIGVLVDFNHMSGWAKDIFVTDQPAATLREMRESILGEDGIGVVETISLPEARRRIEDGIAATDTTWQADVSDDYRDLRALALARCRAMPPAAPGREEREWSDADRGQFVDEFLAAAPIEGDAARYCARLLVDYGCDYDPATPLRVSPVRIEDFLLGFLPRRVMLDADDEAAMPDVLRAWTSWAADRAQLPEAARAELRQVVEDCLERFADEYHDVANMSPARTMLSGLGEISGEADVRDALDRRMFAMPYFGARIGDEDYPQLDPNDPDERHLLVVGEHPEYHEALDDPDFDGEIDGVNPRLHIAMDEIVVAQLWDGDPPETWHAAQKLTAAGLDRWDVIHRLGAVAIEQLHGALTTSEPIDAAAYAAAMNAVQPESPRPRAAGGVYQLKISLRGARPPIWRRIRVPATATLPRLHDVIQAAFGWEDSHLHLFEVGGSRYAPRDFELDHTSDDRRITLSKALPRAGAKIRYDYDFGDGWEHEIVLEEVHEENGATNAVCVGGRRAGPVEDCGGIWGWQELCDVLADPEHPDRAERLEWLGHVPDPARFDLAAVNKALADIRVA